MANTIPDGIYYPENTTDMELDTILATMASSIQNGIGNRLKHQEIAVGLKAGIAATGNVIPVASATAPFVIRSVDGCFNQGFTLANGVATVVTGGMYLVTATLGVQPVNPATRTAAIEIFKGSVSLNAAEVTQHIQFYQTALATCVVNCVPGDTLRAEWKSASSSGSSLGPLAAKTSLTSLSIAMVQATPL